VYATGALGDHPPSVAVWSAHCFFTAHEQIDPIEHFADPSSPHMHAFAAYETPFDSQTPAILRAADPNDCLSPDLTQFGGDPVPDLSSYWAPALRSITLTPTEWIEPAAVLVYYRNAGVDPNTIVPFDEDFSYRAGNPSATLSNPQSDSVMQWSCVAHQVEGVDNEINFGVTIPATCPKYLGDPEDDNPYMLRLVVFFPNCINFGDVTEENGQWKPNDAEYAVDIDDPDPEEQFTKHCSSEGYNPIPQVQIGYRWPLEAGSGIPTDPANNTQWDLSTLRLASDMGASMDQLHGVTGHIDFMSGWSTTQLTELMKTCYWDSSHGGYSGSPRHCGAIGDAAPFYGEN
jgi:hypothetical protein